MKPRLEPAPLTDEDRRIRQSIALRQSASVFDWPSWMRRMAAADRRDADLMYRLTKTGADVEAYLMLSNEPFKATVHSLLES